MSNNYKMWMYSAMFALAFALALAFAFASANCIEYIIH